MASSSHLPATVSSDSRTPSMETSYEPGSDEMLMVFKKIQWLKNRQRILRTCLYSDKFKNETDELGCDELLELITNLQARHREALTNNTVEELCTSRLQLADVLHSVVENHELHPSLTPLAAVKQEFQEMLKEQNELSVKALKEMEDVGKLQNEILEMELKLSVQSAERNHLMEKVSKRVEHQKQEREKISQDRKIQKLEKKYEERSHLLCTMNQIIQSVIGGSTIHWDEENDIKELLFSVSKPIDVQIKEGVLVQDSHRS